MRGPSSAWPATAAAATSALVLARLRRRFTRLDHTRRTRAVRSSSNACLGGGCGAHPQPPRRVERAAKLIPAGQPGDGRLDPAHARERSPSMRWKPTRLAVSGSRIRATHAIATRGALAPTATRSQHTALADPPGAALRVVLPRRPCLRVDAGALQAIISDLEAAYMRDGLAPVLTM